MEVVFASSYKVKLPMLFSPTLLWKDTMNQAPLSLSSILAVTVYERVNKLWEHKCIRASIVKAIITGQAPSFERGFRRQ